MKGGATYVAIDEKKGAIGYAVRIPVNSSHQSHAIGSCYASNVRVAESLLRCYLNYFIGN